MKDQNEMAPHFRKAVEEIDGDIAQLTNDIATLTATRDSLVNLYGGTTEVQPAPAAKKPRAVKVATPAVPSAVTAGRPGKPPRADTIKLMATMRTCPEPFTVPSLQVATGINAKNISNAAIRWTAKGWLEKAGRGQWKRTPAFPAEAPTE